MPHSATAAADATDLQADSQAVVIPEVLPGLQLSQQQCQALQALEEFVASDEKIYLLTGYAGTGKTTLLQALISRLQQNHDGRPIALTALSNKAT